MSILIDENTRVLVQGITGREGTFHSRLMLEYGTKVVAGVTPGKGGQMAVDEKVPVYNTVAQAQAETGANATCIFVPAKFNAAESIMEAADAGIKLIVCLTEFIPQRDEMRSIAYAHSKGAKVIGPNCPGLLSVNKCKIGIIPSGMFSPGPVGICSRSGTLTYESVDALSRAGLGQTTCVGIGGDPFPGMRFIDLLPLFEADPDTKVIVMCGEVGGNDEEIAAEYIKTMKKPVVGFIAGRTAPPGKRMGHAGAIISGKSGGPQAKVDALLGAGVFVADTPSEIPDLVKKALGKAA
jgi:succinyl-CoA synthetase alpha subunit